MSSINITGYDNEDIIRVFTLATGTVDSHAPIDISSLEFEADIVDSKTQEVVLRMTSDGDDGHIVKTDAVNGVFEIVINQGDIEYVPKRSLNYDILRRDSQNVLTRLWGGRVSILDGTTVP